MLKHNLEYAMKTMLKNKSFIIWTLIFPIALATFMYLAFGNLFEREEMFHAIPVAVVDTVSNEAFESVMKELSKEGDNQLLDAKYMTEEQAKEALTKDEVSAIIYVEDDIRLTVGGNSFKNTVLSTIIRQYKKSEQVLKNVAQRNPAAMSQAVENLMGEKEFFVEKSTSGGNQDAYTNYFYAIFAMSCLFASFSATDKITKLQANESALGMRRCLSPNPKSITILAEFISMLSLQFVAEILTFIYLNLIGVDFGDRYALILLILFFGSCIGVALGVIIGSAYKLSDGLKTSICVAISMTLSVLADLCVGGIKDAIEHAAPIINRINPAALIVDAFYALNVYDTYERYTRDIVTLGVMAAGMLAVSFFILRRNRYASL